MLQHLLHTDLDDVELIGARARPGRRVINLYSDTQTRPTAEMREAMAAAEVGDEQ